MLSHLKIGSKKVSNYLIISWIHEFSRRLKRLSGVVVESALRACLTFSKEFANLLNHCNMNQLLKKFGIKDIAKNNMNQIEGIS